MDFPEQLEFRTSYLYDIYGHRKLLSFNTEKHLMLTF